MSRGKSGRDVAMWTAVGGATLLGAWLLRRNASQGVGQPGRVVVHVGSEVRRVFGIPFGKPLPHALVAGGWGDERPKHVGSYHYAIDLPAPMGTPVRAVTAGTVVLADAGGKSTAGRYVVIRSGGVHTRYLHLSVVGVRVGQRVELGQVIGLVGSTGFSSGPHLHLDVFLSDELLAAYRETFGVPVPPFPAKRRWGTQVPAEALIPVDRYSRNVVARAVARGVSLATI